jgi:hypothetical protein
MKKLVAAATLVSVFGLLLTVGALAQSAPGQAQPENLPSLALRRWE